MNNSKVDSTEQEASSWNAAKSSTPFSTYREFNLSGNYLLQQKSHLI